MAAKSWTHISEAEVLNHYRTLTLPQLRRHQDLVQQQIISAHRQRNTLALESLRYAEEMLTRAVMERV